jgi:hypothetical protein
MPVPSSLCASSRKGIQNCHGTNLIHGIHENILKDSP